MAAEPHRFMQELNWEEREEEDHSARTVTVLLLERAGSLIRHKFITSEEDPMGRVCLELRRFNCTSTNKLFGV